MSAWKLRMQENEEVVVVVEVVIIILVHETEPDEEKDDLSRVRGIITIVSDILARTK